MFLAFLADSSVLSDEQVWEKDQINDATRREIFHDTEETMQEYRNKILDEIRREIGFPYPNTEDGTSLYDHAVFITDPISNMGSYEEEGWSIS